ncbi:MAG: AhpC/TSA family protein [Muribaculaceae bacterium]|nr:AhpC/TSA family protein [Muribaculaceae bacterium]
MNIKSLALASLSVAAIITGCSKKAGNAGQEYQLDVVVTDPGADNTYAYLYDFDTNEVIDSVIVTDGHALFDGQIDGPAVVNLVVNGNRVGRFFLEGGASVYDNGHITSELNDKYEHFVADIRAVSDSLMNAMDSTWTEVEQEAHYLMLQAHIDSLVNKHIVENISNPLGYYLFVQQAMSMEADKFKEMLDLNPELKNYKRVGKINDNFAAREATSAGKHYTDFEVEYNGTTTRLSDYVKPGQYTLVDFWASWCGPCKREIEIIKDLYAKYNGRGLDVVGVAVWEEPDQTNAYLAENPLPWNIIVNGQHGPTDIYGINGIPCIILIDPDGNIVARDLMEGELINTVTTAMGE